MSRKLTAVRPLRDCFRCREQPLSSSQSSQGSHIQWLIKAKGQKTGSSGPNQTTLMNNFSSEVLGRVGRRSYCQPPITIQPPPRLIPDSFPSLHRCRFQRHSKSNALDAKHYLRICFLKKTKQSTQWNVLSHPGPQPSNSLHWHPVLSVSCSSSIDILCIWANMYLHTYIHTHIGNKWEQIDKYSCIYTWFYIYNYIYKIM